VRQHGNREIDSEILYLLKESDVRKYYHLDHVHLPKYLFDHARGTGIDAALRMARISNNARAITDAVIVRTGSISSSLICKRNSVRSYPIVW
jgi:hypothetical protein